MIKIRNRNQIKDIISSLENPVICEVGVRFGDNFKNMLTNNVSEAYGIDIWQNTGLDGQNDALCTQEELDSQYNLVIEKFKSDNRVKIIRDYSVNCAKLFSDEYFDFIYLDADHTYQSVLEDLNSWWPKIKKGGILSGHDYIDGDLTIKLGHSVRFGVVDAVNEFLTNNNIKSDNFHLTSEQYASYFIIKE